MIVHVNMLEVPGTSFDAKDSPAVAQFTALLANKTAPVFEAEPGGGLRVFSEVVAVVYRDEAGKPVHGGLFGFGADGVASISLKDLAGKVDTGTDPAHVAFGLLMMRGPLVFRQGGADNVMRLSIVEIQHGKLDAPLRLETESRRAVKEAYLTAVLPSARLTEHCEP